MLQHTNCNSTDVLCVKAQLTWAGVDIEKLAPCTSGKKQMLKISETSCKKRETQVYTPGLLFRRPEENVLLLFSESLERNIVMMNFICIGIPISASDEKIVN